MVEAAEGVPAEETPATAEEASSRGGQAASRCPGAWEWYPLIYTLRLAATIGCVLLVLPVYRQFPCRVTALAWIVGALWAPHLWIGICRLNLEERFLEPMGLGSLLGLGERAAYNPFKALGGQMVYLVGFLVVRFVGLVLLVPLIEEFFYRGFLMRFVIAPEWWKVRIGTRHTFSLVVGTLYGVLTHPAEMIAAALWFTLISWLMLKTRNLWDCVAAHAVTNLLLGIYVVTTGDWALW